MAAPAPTLPPIADLPTLPTASLTAILNLLFEPTADLHALAVPTMQSITFASYAELIDTLRDSLLTIQRNLAPPAEDGEDPGRTPLHAVLAAHPRLGASKVASAQSAAEQAQLGGGEPAALAGLNEAYEARFPGLRYVVFVNGRSREVVMEDMRRRIERGNLAAEEVEGIQAMCDIAKDRAGKLETSSG